MSSISNIIESNVPFVADRNYAPTRTFVTKWDIEIDNNRAKKIARRRERDTKYFDYYDEEYESLPLGQIDESNDCGWELEISDDGEGEETRQRWLRSVAAENAYYDLKYGRSFEWYDMNEAELDTDQAAPCNKRGLDFEEQRLFKRVRA
uniref:Uncharacterized protein n=1 Tax=viral metagenome TaxID=1070528 RepID=A0A6C0D1X8_9ZZZZ